MINYSNQIFDILDKTLKSHDKATFVVSGGSSPIKIFNELSSMPINWSKVTVTLVDDRFVDKSHKDSNEKLVFENPNGTKSEFKLDRTFMKKVGEAKSGEKLKIENLNFVINTFAVVPESRGKMYELLLVLQKNPSLKIEIQGHLCCMPVDRADLSTQRAKALYNFLLNQNISKDRLSYKGFGSSQPIYALPEKDEQERAANRRVEIFIVNK